jgi:hypothetical protein
MLSSRAVATTDGGTYVHSPVFVVVFVVVVTDEASELVGDEHALAMTASPVTTGTRGRREGTIRTAAHYTRH